MNLQTILYGDFVPPPVANTRVVFKSGFYGGKSYVEPKTRQTQEKPMYAAVRQLLAKKPRLNINQVSEELGKSFSYTYSILMELKEKKEVGCAPGQKPKKGGNIPVVFFLL